MTDQTSLPRAIPLAVSSYALCIYSDGHTIAGHPDAIFRLPFIRGQAATPIGGYTIEARDAGFVACLDGEPIADPKISDLAARGAAVSHYAARAIEVTFGSSLRLQSGAMASLDA